MRFLRQRSHRALPIATWLACCAPMVGLGACASSSETPESDESPVEAGSAPVAPADAALDARGPLPAADAAVASDGGALGSAWDAESNLDASHPVDGGHMSVDSSAPATDSGRPYDGSAAHDAGAVDAAASDAAPRDSGTPGKAAKFVGNITTRGQVRNDFRPTWDQITPENEGKWGSVEPTRDQMNWAGMDRAYAFSREQHIPFKGHTLVWGSQQPSWLNGLSSSEQAAEVEEWIRLFCERYPDVELIDVVNEPPPHTTPVYMNALGGAGASGYDWIVQAFRLARRYCPRAVLILNDYNTIEYAADNARFIDIVNAIKRAGAPIDAVGAQAHDAYKLPTASVQQFLDKLAQDTGLPVYISEYDVNLANDAQQRQVMESQFSMFWRHPKVKGITLWGYVAGATWLPNTGLMSSSGTPRPALTWLLGFLESVR